MAKRLGKGKIFLSPGNSKPVSIYVPAIRQIEGEFTQISQIQIKIMVVFL
jgi:hypothetical protein